MMEENIPAGAEGDAMRARLESLREKMKEGKIPDDMLKSLDEAAANCMSDGTVSAAELAQMDFCIGLVLVTGEIPGFAAAAAADEGAQPQQPPPEYRPTFVPQQRYAPQRPASSQPQPPVKRG
jgi:hypothetical protein